MCQYMIEIAKENRERACYRCEHGTFHLIWDNGVFSLTLKELYILKGLLIDIRQGEASTQQERIRIQQFKTSRGSEFFELWMTNAGMMLLPQDCRMLEKLIDNSLNWLQKQPPFSREEHLKAAQWRINMDSLPITLESLHWN